MKVNIGFVAAYGSYAVGAAGSPAIQVPKFGLILGDCAQEKNILVQGKGNVP